MANFTLTKISNGIKGKFFVIEQLSICEPEKQQELLGSLSVPVLSSYFTSGYFC